MPDDHAFETQFDTAADMLDAVADSCQRAGLSANVWYSVLLSHLVQMAVQSGLSNDDALGELKEALTYYRTHRPMQ